MTCIETMISIYLISTVGMYFFIKKQFSKGGCWENLKPNIFDLFFTFVPVCNTVSFICNTVWFIGSMIMTTEFKFDLSKFYNVKK